jgi:hypothetical protein
MNKSYLKSVEQGYMSVEQARQMILGNSGSNDIGSVDLLIANDIARYNEVYSLGYYKEKYGEPGKIRCPYCGRKNDSDKEVCGGCGGNL